MGSRVGLVRFDTKLSFKKMRYSGERREKKNGEREREREIFEKRFGAVVISPPTYSNTYIRVL